jgi:hypothetical protein
VVPTVEPSNDQNPYEAQHHRAKAADNREGQELQAKECSAGPSNRGRGGDHDEDLPWRRLSGDALLPRWVWHYDRSPRHAPTMPDAQYLGTPNRPVSIDQSGEESGEGDLNETPSAAFQLLIAAAASAL